MKTTEQLRQEARTLSNADFDVWDTKCFETGVALGRNLQRWEDESHIGTRLLTKINITHRDVENLFEEE